MRSNPAIANRGLVAVRAAGGPGRWLGIVEDQHALMKKKVFFTVLWTAVFAGVTLIAGMVGFGLLGLAGLAAWKGSTVVFIGKTWSLVLFAMPVLGLILSLFGVLPGTHCKRKETLT